MITTLFSHVKGISTHFEKQLNENGVFHWDDFFEKIDALTSLPKSKIDKIRAELLLSKAALTNKNLHYFKNTFKPNEHWRLWNLGKIGYVDIETTGLSSDYSDITVIGIYDGLASHFYVNGKNLHDAHAKLLEFDIVVTFNGKQFDIPFIEHHFSCKYDFVHLDLRYMLKELGFQGGLKNIEYELGIRRDTDLEGVDGFEAVRLWNKYLRGNQAALAKLLRYNEQDVINLKTLFDYYLSRKQGTLYQADKTI